MHKCVCSNQCNKKGGCAVRAVVTVAPHCTAGQDRKPPVTTTPWSKAICYFPLISPLDTCNLSNLALYHLLALLQGTFTETRDEQCACCIRDEHTCGLYLIH